LELTSQPVADSEDILLISYYSFRRTQLYCNKTDIEQLGTPELKSSNTFAATNLLQCLQDAEHFLGLYLVVVATTLINSQNLHGSSFAMKTLSDPPRFISWLPFHISEGREVEHV